ncbi:uncharacterized [Tachysurus ichikawai]
MARTNLSTIRDANFFWLCDVTSDIHAIWRGLPTSDVLPGLPGSIPRPSRSSSSPDQPLLSLLMSSDVGDLHMDHVARITMQQHHLTFRL